MVLKITESYFLSEILSSEKYLNSSLIGKIDLLNHVRTSRAWFGWGHNTIKKVIEDQPSKKIQYKNLNWKTYKSLDVTLYRDTSGNYIIEYPINQSDSAFADRDNLSGPLFSIGTDGGGTVKRTIEKFCSYPTTGYHSTENTKFIRYLRSIYNESWLDLKRKVVADLKKSIDNDSIAEYLDSKKADRTVAIMKMAKSINNLLSSVEAYKQSIPNVLNEKEADNLLKTVERYFYTLRLDHNRINWNSINPKKKIPGGKKVMKVLQDIEEKA